MFLARLPSHEKRFRFASFVVAGLLHAASPVSALTFNDGLVHDIDTPIFDGIVVDDGPGGSATTLNVLPGAFVSGNVDVFGSSLVNVTGGQIGSELIAHDSSVADVSSGQVDEVLRALGSSVVTVTGGLFGNDWVTDDGATLTLSGGVLQGSPLAFFVNGSSVLTIIGSGFNMPLGDVVPTAGTVSGILSDSNAFGRDFTRASSGTITLVPEPSTGSLLALALVGAVWLGARRGSAGSRRVS